VVVGELAAEPLEPVQDRRRADHRAAVAAAALEQGRQLGAPGLRVGTEPAEERYGLGVAARRITEAITWNSSADIGMTRSRSVVEGAITRGPMTSPLARWYWRHETRRVRRSGLDVEVAAWQRRA
jgi:hypothetical protein